MLKLSGLWKKNGPKGPFLVGKINDSVSIMVFPNKEKNNENQPDYQVMLVENKPREGGYQKKPYTPRQAPQTKPQPVQAPKDPVEPPYDGPTFEDEF